MLYAVTEDKSAAGQILSVALSRQLPTCASRVTRAGQTMVALAVSCWPWMLRLIQPYCVATRQRQCRDQSPALIVHWAAAHALRLQLHHRDRKVITHQIELRPLIMRRGVERSLTRRQGKDQPSMPRVDRVKAKYVTKKITISLSVLTVKYKMRSIDHIHLLAASIAGLFPPSRRKQLLRRRPVHAFNARAGSTPAHDRSPSPPPASMHTQSPAPQI